MTEISKEYGTAMFMLALEEGRQEEYGEALCKVRDTFVENPDFSALLTSPGIPLRERLGIIESTFGESVPERVLSYLMLLCEKGRLSDFEQSVSEYTALFEASEHIMNAKITSADELCEEEKKKLISKLEATYKGKIRGEYYVDKTLIGGVIVEIDGKVMDGSLRHRLEEVKEVMNS